MEFDAVALEYLREKPVGPSIKIVRGNNLIARVEQLYH